LSHTHQHTATSPDTEWLRTFADYWKRIGPETKDAIVGLLPDDWSLEGKRCWTSDWWLREHWGRAFEVVEIGPRIHNSSWALLRKRDISVTVDDVARPADDPREYYAVRHNLLRAQREIDYAEARLAAAQREAAEQLAALRDSRERSRSWRVTGPLRQLARCARTRRSGG